MESLGATLASTTDPYALVVRSPVVPGSTEGVLAPAMREAGRDENGHVAKNPEFQREGSAVEDLLNPDELVVGTDSDYGREGRWLRSVAARGRRRRE